VPAERNNLDNLKKPTSILESEDHHRISIKSSLFSLVLFYSSKLRVCVA